MVLTRKRVYGGKRSIQKKIKAQKWFKGSGLSATGPFQSLARTEEYGTFFANASGNIGQLGVDTTGFQLNALVLGTSYNARIGERVLNKSIEVNYWIIPGASQTTYRNVRVMVIYDKLTNNNSALPGATDFINTDSTTGFIEPQVMQKYTVLYNKLHNIGPSANMDCGVAENVYRKVSLESVYINNNGTLNDLSGGALLFMIFGDNAVSSNNQPTFQMSSKLRFIK